jgi:Mg/Co/Ni transporter MgtE
MTPTPTSIPANTTIDYVVADYFSVYRYHSYPVVDSSSHVIGFINDDLVGTITPSEYDSHTAADLADRNTELFIDENEEVSKLLNKQGFLRFGCAAVVDANTKLVGLISITDVKRALRSAVTNRQPA